MKSCKHEYKPEISNHSTTGLIWVCEKCNLVQPYKRIKKTYMETMLEKHNKNK